MAEEQKTKLRLEIAHVLFIDIVGYSRLLMDDQTEVVQELTDLVRKTEAVCDAEAAGHLVRLPAGDGMALVFTGSVETAVECALQISKALRDHPRLPIRMGIHTGPVHHVEDVNERTNVAGGGINIAQRVMDCADAGHILLSKRVADDLAQYRHWQPCLHQLGEFEVKHGLRLPLVNLAGEEFGNRDVPKKLLALGYHQRSRRRWRVLAMVVLAIAILAAAFFFVGRKQTRIREPRATPTSAAKAPEKSVAVLPFENLSSDPDNAFFADGVQDEILTRLAKIADLKVTSRTSVMQYKSGVRRNLREIGQQLGVAHLLEGSVQRAGNKVRVNAQLNDTRSDAHVWAQSYDRDLADVFAIQSEIAQAIADQLQAKLSPKEKAAIEEQPTADVTAFELYSRAKTVLATGLATSQEKSFLQAVELLDRAVARDPSFYAAFCQLVFINDSLYAGYDHSQARLSAAESALHNAERLRPNAAETHLARGQHLYYAARDFPGAVAELEIAARGLPNDARVLETTGYILRRQGKNEEGLHMLEQAVALDPRNVFMLAQIVLSYQGLRRYPEESAVLARILEITPDDVSSESTRVGLALLGQADPRPVKNFIERLRAERPAALSDAATEWLIGAFAERDWTGAEQAVAAMGDNPFLNDWSVKLSRQFAEGLLARAMHDDARARIAFTAARLEQEQIVTKQRDFGPAVCVLGLIDAALGNKDAALAEGRRAMELLPVEKDPNGGHRLMAYCAVIAAWVGEKDLALEQLKIAAPTPGGSLIASYGFLTVTPFWDSLRGDPRFEKIVADLAPKE
ncbi:MAG: hypothetical protein M3128_05720 [Verrucomicrobiota bacterium]|nr:hypothetical protein [Verrucomicrobiota bacterium]